MVIHRSRETADRAIEAGTAAYTSNGATRTRESTRGRRPARARSWCRPMSTSTSQPRSGLVRATTAPSSRREREIVALAGEGKRALGIARSLRFSPGTAQTRLSPLSAKLMASDRAASVAEAVCRGRD